MICRHNANSTFMNRVSEEGGGAGCLKREGTKDCLTV